MWESPVYIETFIHKQTMNQTTLKKGSPRFCTKSPTYCTNIIKGVGVGLDSSGLLINVVRIFLCHPFIHVPFYMQGFIQGGGGGGLEFPPPEILKLSMVIIVLSQVLNNNLVPDCVRSNLRGSKIQNFPGGHAPRPPLVGTHACACVSVLSHTCYHPVPPHPNSKSCMKP